MSPATTSVELMRSAVVMPSRLKFGSWAIWTMRALVTEARSAGENWPSEAKMARTGLSPSVTFEGMG